ncbi:uncharacterized protein [Argopecten irradians]|uniref:uncharacterized protein n=1 Tax=Argopecten irradians TaxID=31199 RepID=UPI003713AD6F
MSEVDLFQDSESNSQEIGEREEEDNASFLDTTNIDLPAIMRELKDIKAKQEEILKALTEMKSTSRVTFHVESSSVKKPLIAVLKGMFYTSPWLDEDNSQILTVEIKKIFKNVHEPAEPSAVVKCVSFAHYHFTNWRNQVRHKLVTNGKKVEVMPLSQLQTYLFGMFGSYGGDVILNMRTTVALRAFVDSRKLFGTNSTVGIDFWESFRNTTKGLTEERWKRLKERQERKIEDIRKED